MVDVGRGRGRGVPRVVAAVGAGHGDTRRGDGLAGSGGAGDENDRVAEESAAAAAELGDFIDSLPEGLDTLVGERGLKLSGEERQQWWERSAAVFPPYNEYAGKTSRTIPVLVAERA